MSILTHMVTALAIFLISIATPLHAAEAPVAPPPEDLSLETILKSTLARNGQIQESEGDIQIARAQLQQARAAAFPKAGALLLAAPMFEVRGDALHYTQNWSHWGPFLRADVQLVQPLFTFGQIDSYKKAAENQITAREGQADMKRLEIIATAKEFYYSFLMAADLDKLVGDLVDYLGEASQKADEAVKSEKKSSVKPHDAFKLKTALEELRQKKLLAEAGKKTAERAVAWVSGLKFEKLPGHKIEPEDYQEKSLDEYLRLAHENRPEIRALKAGQEARLALAQAKEAQSYPVIFAGAFAGQGWCPVCDKQTSIFANDPFNRTTGGAGLGVKFDLEFWRHSAEAAEQRAEAMKLKATESYAVPGIDLQVKRAYWELEQQKEGLEIAERRRQTARKWFVQSAMGWSIGITPAKDLLEALEGDGLSRKNYIETVFALNMALAHLTQAVGVEVTGLKYH